MTIHDDGKGMSSRWHSIHLPILDDTEVRATRSAGDTKCGRRSAGEVRAIQICRIILERPTERGHRTAFTGAPQGRLAARNRNTPNSQPRAARLGVPDSALRASAAGPLQRLFRPALAAVMGTANPPR